VSFADELKTDDYRKQSVRTWFTRLPEGQMKDELRAVKAAFEAGDYDGKPKRHIARRCIEHFGLDCKSDAFVQWLDGRTAS